MVDLLGILCCPHCKGEIEAACRVVTPSARLKSGVFFCRRCDDVVGTVRNFQYDFLYFDKTACAERLRRSGPGHRPVRLLEYETVDETVPFDDQRIQLRGSWEQWEGKYQLSHGRSGDALAFSGEFLDVSVRLLKHPWSGCVRFLLDGETVGEEDLYQPKWSEVHWFPIANDLEPGAHSVAIVPTGHKNPNSAASQVFFHELIVTRPAENSAIDTLTSREINRVLPIFPTVLDLMKQVPEDGLILDCGGGDRVLADSRYVNVDCQRYQLPAIWADVLKLPFKSDTFDLVFSQALLEHVPNPFAAVEEMRRVARTGGTLWAGMAFMQPVHAVPSHYFNATVWGIQELFSILEVLEVSWFGDLSFTIDWLFKAAGVAERMDRPDYDDLMDRIKSLDRLVSHEALREVASGVAVLARKPAPPCPGGSHPDRA